MALFTKRYGVRPLLVALILRSIYYLGIGLTLNILGALNVSFPPLLGDQEAVPRPQSAANPTPSRFWPSPADQQDRVRGELRGQPRHLHPWLQGHDHGCGIPVPRWLHRDQRPGALRARALLQHPGMINSAGWGHRQPGCRFFRSWKVPVTLIDSAENNSLRSNLCMG